jgi:t-SNARE complex subunit (syntaxin)
MIVDVSKVETALEYLNADPHPLARAQRDIFVAENNSKRVFARAFLNAEGSVEARKAIAELDVDYISARNREAEAIEQLHDHREHKNGAEFIIEAWRTEQSNIRASERVR